MTLRRSDVCAWLLAGSLLAAAPALAQKKTNKPLTPEQQAERAKFDPKAEASPFGGNVVEERVAQVNDQIITTSDYNRSAAQLEQEGRQQDWSEQELQDHKRDLLRDLIDQQLLLSKGKELDINGETELVRRLDDIRKQNHLDSMEDLEKAAASQGASYEDFKQNIRNGIITQQVIREEVGRRIQMTQAELQQYYQKHQSDFTQPESVRLSEILVPVSSTGDEAANLAAAKAKADDLDAKIKGGANFADLAKANSANSTAAEGGDLGTWTRGKLAKQLEDATFALPAGQSTEPIRTRQGYVILKVTEHTPGGTQPLAAIRPQVEEAAFMSEMQPRLREYLAKLRENAYIDVRPGYEDTAAVKNPTKPTYSAYTPPGPKKKVHFKRSRYTGAHRGRHAGEATETATNTPGTKTTNSTGNGAEGNAAATATAGNPGSTAAAGKTTAAGTTTALAKTPAVEKPGKKEKIRFGQAPREALPPAAHPTNGSEQAAGTEAGAGAESQVASNSTSTDVPGDENVGTVERKTRFSYRAREPKGKKPKTPDQVENERVAQPVAPEETAAQKTQSAPLGLAGDTAAKKKAPKEKGEKKTRYSDEVNKKETAPATPQGSTPSPLATPGTVPASADNPPADNGTAPAPQNGTTPAGVPTPPPAQPQQ
ncbi:MAG TPA: peptidyl-prolyl cis-trans isomerase [Acidobacteriaceae bacterium]|jgi:peptidyl-prolyl cis-trans isomerase SurA|nr:peptidyl-prolyl cis-trans isomerase [Acidobacteriaceae bacterium]